MKKYIHIIACFFFCVVFTLLGLWLVLLSPSAATPAGNVVLSLFGALSFLCAIVFSYFGCELCSKEKGSRGGR